MLLFLDTCAILNHSTEIFESGETFYISNLTINELENIKTGLRDEETKYNARCLLHKLKENKDKCVIIPFKNHFLDAIMEFDLPITTDSKIIATAFDFYKNSSMEYPSDKKFFCTDDLACETIARSIGLPIFSFEDTEEKEEYTGYKEINLDELDLANFYNNEMVNPQNIYELYINEYLIIKQAGRVVDKYKWTANGYEQVQFVKFESDMLGKLIAMDGDVYQSLALDCLKSNQITMLRGAAGTGKSYLALGYLFSQLEHGKIDKIIIFCNTVAAKGAARMGFYPGSKDEKLLDSQIGNFLKGKIPDRIYLEKLLDEGIITLIPMADIRGYDTSGMNAGVYITEAQNMDIELMRLALQRIGEDSICILDGDSNAQVDLSDYAGSKNGMRRVSKVFRGADFYGEVTLNTIKRSKIAALAQKM